MHSTSAATIAQPPAKPVFGPKARVPQVNVVPQSGSALFSSLYPIEVRKIVGRRGRGDAHGGRGDQPEGTGLEPLLHLLLRDTRRRAFGSGHSPLTFHFGH